MFHASLQFVEKEGKKATMTSVAKGNMMKGAVSRVLSVEKDTNAVKVAVRRAKLAVKKMANWVNHKMMGAARL